MVLFDIRSQQYDAAVAIGSARLVAARCDDCDFDRAGDFGWHRSVDAGVSRTAIECLSQLGGNHLWIERGGSRGVDRADFLIHKGLAKITGVDIQ